MKNKLFIKSLCSYLKDHLVIWLCLLSTLLLFFILATLKGYDKDIILYALLLSFLIISIILSIDFYFYYQKYLSLEKVKKQIHVTLQQLPQSKNTIEKQYTELLQIVFTTMQESKSLYDNQYQELLEYYTLWVHQVKTPIAAMRLLLQMDKQNNHDLLLELSKIEQYVEMVLHYLRLKTMSNDLLLKKYSLEDILHEAIKKQSHFFIRKNIHLQLEPIDIMVLTDQKWLLFVIEQILSNALKYTPNNGSIHIYVQDYTLVIEDTGSGIIAEDLPRVFDKGFTGYNGRINKTSTGIGLYLCKEIITNLSHHIRIDSVYHQGTRVSINLKSTDSIYD